MRCIGILAEVWQRIMGLAFYKTAWTARRSCAQGRRAPNSAQLDAFEQVDEALIGRNKIPKESWLLVAAPRRTASQVGFAHAGRHDATTLKRFSDGEGSPEVRAVTDGWSLRSQAAAAGCEGIQGGCEILCHVCPAVEGVRSIVAADGQMGSDNVSQNSRQMALHVFLPSGGCRWVHAVPPHWQCLQSASSEGIDNFARQTS
jgi:hypothetical protein